jgi:hypothetical protein
MRLIHLVGLVLLAAICLSIARDEVGRVALIVFFAGLGTIAVTTAALLLLFRTLGGLGEAQRGLAYVEALAATALVLVLASLAVGGLVLVGVRLVQLSVS